MTPVIFTLEDCPNCDMVKERFAEKNISFMERLLDTDAVCDLMLKYNKVVTAAPVILFDGAVYDHREILNRI